MIITAWSRVSSRHRTFLKWSQPGWSDAVVNARATYVSPAAKTIAKSSNPAGAKTETGLSLSEILYELKRFMSSRETKNQSVVLSGVCNLAKENVMKLPVPMQLSQRILVFTTPDKFELARQKGGDIVGGEELMNDILEGKLKFDRCIATTNMLPLVTKLARYLGPLGMMPNVKTGTLTNDVGRALEDARSNIPYRIEKFSGIFNIPVAKASFTESDTERNIRAALKCLLEIGQGTVKKGCFIDRVSVSTHGKFVRQLAQSEYWMKQRKARQLPPTAAIPSGYSLKASPGVQAAAKK